MCAPVRMHWDSGFRSTGRHYDTQSPYMMSVAAANLAEAYFELGDWQQAEHFAQEVLAQEEPQSYAYGLFTLGRLHQARANWTAAATHFREIIRITEANGDAFMGAYAQRELGAIYQATGCMAEARQELQSALRRFEQMNITDEIDKTQVALQALSVVINCKLPDCTHW